MATAKSSKLEDYWKQQNIESVFKELTHIIVQKMPPDPILAIVQHLQKKYPASFKRSPDDSMNKSIGPKVTSNTLRSQSIVSAHSEADMYSMPNRSVDRRASTHSQTSAGPVIPSLDSAFTDLLRRGSGTLQLPATVDLRNLVSVARIEQHAIKLGKNIQSDRDILEEELIRPNKHKGDHIEQDHTVPSVSMNGQQEEEERPPQPSTLQLIKYKQNIRDENDRRLHRETLAKLAQKSYEEEERLQSSVASAPNQESQPGAAAGDAAKSSGNTRDARKAKPQQKTTLGIEEEELLKDEVAFDSHNRPKRDRQRRKYSTSPYDVQRSRGQTLASGTITSRIPDLQALPMMQFVICKVCGNTLNMEDNISTRAPPPTESRPLVPQQAIEASNDLVDDWFESASDVSSSRRIPTWSPDEKTPDAVESNPLKATHFQPIQDRNPAVTHRPPAVPLIMADDETGLKRIKTPRMSESDVFVRTPEPPTHRNLTSPVAKKHQKDFLAAGSPIFEPLSPEPTVDRSISFNNQRRGSGWSVRENSPDGSEN